MKNSDREKIAQKAKTKKDGVYSLNGMAYRVKNGLVTHYAADYSVYLNCGFFITEIGKYEYNAVKILKAISD